MARRVPFLESEMHSTRHHPHHLFLLQIEGVLAVLEGHNTFQNPRWNRAQNRQNNPHKYEAQPILTVARTAP